MNHSDSIESLRRLCADLPNGDEDAANTATQRQSMLTKPPGSLGRLEELAIFMARWQGRAVPRIDRTEVLIFAGAHGVSARGVSAFPAEVTGQMVANFQAGGAAINQLARQAGATLKVTPLAIEQPTKDFTQAPAMAEGEFLDAVTAGFAAVDSSCDLVCVGEMGIGNTTAAATVCAALFGGNGSDWVGRGTGVDDAGLLRKAETVDAALALHGAALGDPLEALRRVGGRELAAIFGATLAARLNSIPILLDGFVATAAAAPMLRLAGGGLDHALAGHVSAETQHRRLLSMLGLSPLLDLGMRLGEGSGACLAINVLRGALACHAGMATFAEAGVSGA
ncbi:nicotinate-nucleotide--dimethylbenzimidazole phosphoribosyltransferase [Mesorhizobium sp. CAU 1741]|uniref:nicotinate-nucleotide--dimethylbenzimidazole phosphoribosyltransferase n=1 Tax=Mesorhizobium sp. CAU 1741 TaxID=3140366 RepID=UPI00325B31B0